MTMLNQKRRDAALNKELAAVKSRKRFDGTAQICVCTERHGILDPA